MNRKKTQMPLGVAIYNVCDGFFFILIGIVVACGLV